MRYFRYFLLVLLTLATPACLVVDEDEPGAGAVISRVDTVALDTVVLVDTLRVVDTVVALGEVELDSTPPGSPLRLTQDGDDLLTLRARHLLVPVPGVRAVDVPDSFNETRGGTRRHEAVDIPAPRGTPVLSTDAGVVAKLHTSAAGGLMVYTEDPSRRYVYYYAHLDGYRPGLQEGATLARGDTLGYVGTTGNAPPNVPHLHFGIGRMDAEKRWWKVTALDPRPILIASEEEVAAQAETSSVNGRRRALR